MHQTQFRAALDLSGVEAAFSVAPPEAPPLFSVHKPMRGRSAALLVEWLREMLKPHAIELGQITEWTVGSGPGSFTGLRLASALVGGLIYGKEGVKARALPTALAMAAGLSPEPGTRTGVLFDGRNNELLLYGTAVDASGNICPDGVSMVIDAANAAESCAGFDRLTAFACDHAAINRILCGASVAEPEYQEHLPVERMFDIVSDNWNNDLTGLVYIRQAVFTKPIFP